MSTPPSAARPQRLVLHGGCWREDTRMLRAFAERRGYRLTYDRGVLEIIGPLFEREVDADLLGRFVVVLTEEMGLPRQAGGSSTLRRRGLQRGLDPDQCWWIAHAPQMQGKRKLDLRSDPPPDLAVEIDVTNRSVKRMPIYARLGVPEVWRLTDQGLTFPILQPNGRYAEQPHSLSFPLFRPADLTAHLALRAQHDENEVVRRFRAFVRQRLASGPASAAPADAAPPP